MSDASIEKKNNPQPEQDIPYLDLSERVIENQLKMLIQAGAKERLDSKENAQFLKLNRQLKSIRELKRESSPPEKEKPLQLKTLMQVVQYLSDQGWAIKKSAVYNHANKGLIPRTKEGMFLTTAIDTYAASYLKKLDGTDPKAVTRPVPEQDGIYQTEIRLRHDLAKTKILEQKLAYLNGTLVEKTKADQDTIALVARIYSDAINLIHSNAQEIVAIVHGEPTYISDLIDFQEKEVNASFARYAAETTITIPAADLEAYRAIVAEYQENREQEEGGDDDEEIPENEN